MTTRKKTYLLLLGLFLFTAITFMSFKWQPAEVYQGPPVSLYKLSAPKLKDETTVSNDAKRLLNKSDAKAKRVEQRLRVESDSDPTELYEQDEKGNLLFNKSLKKYADAFRPSLLDDKQSEAAARKFLADNNLLPADQAEMKLAHIGGLRATKAETKEVIDKLKTVTFSRQLDGLPVVGPGSKMVVHLGDKGEVTGGIRRWREVEKSSKRNLDTRELKSESEAKQEVIARIQQRWGKNAKSQLSDGQIAYYDNNEGYVQPVYLFPATITLDVSRERNNSKTAVEDYLGIIPLMRNAPEKIEDVPDPSKAAKTATYNKAQDTERKADPSKRGSSPTAMATKPTT